MDEEFFKPLKMKDTGAHFHLGKNNYKRGVTNHIKDEGVIKSVPNFEKD